tara:strand:+ start:5715 stop:6824 length:1110 start_codon:yes stop_codon:yes gene_type:complete
MNLQEIKFKGTKNYSVIIGKNTLKILFKKVMTLCPKVQKVAFIVDNNVPKNFKISLSKKFKNFDLLIYNFDSNEKNKSLISVNKLLNKLFTKNFNRSDLIISVGGGIAGDIAGFVASIYKRGINFINIPTTLLAQVDSAIGGKTGVNSSYGKNLIGSFNQPKLVIVDISFLKTLPKKEMICGFAEILKHAIIKDRKFFNWLKINSKKILSKNNNALVYAIKKSCEIKMFFVNKDVNEKNIRMKLNFGHTFAHAIEVKNNYSKKNTHGEAVLSGMILATRLSVVKKICRPKVLDEIKKIYEKNNLTYTYKKFSKKKSIESLIPYLKQDKKNNDSKINFILLKNIGKTTEPNKNKISTIKLKKLSHKIIQH